MDKRFCPKAMPSERREFLTRLFYPGRKLGRELETHFHSSFPVFILLFFHARWQGGIKRERAIV